MKDEKKPLPPPTLIDARSIPCQEPDENGQGGSPSGTHYFSSSRTAKDQAEGIMRCGYCGLVVSDEVP